MLSFAVLPQKVNAIIKTGITTTSDNRAANTIRFISLLFDQQG